MFVIEATANEHFPELRNTHKRVVYANSLWQKERLLNLLLESVPKCYSKVAWLDSDILFENPSWFAEAAALLDYHPVVQPFSEAIRLPRGDTWYHGKGDRFMSFASLPYDITSAPDSPSGFPIHWHGHTGFAWAGQRRWVQEVGLYDVCLSGSADHLMAHAFYGDVQGACIDRAFGNCQAYKNHFLRWAKRISEIFDGKIGCVPGRVFHLWHGEEGNRRYFDHNQELIDMGFDPEKDLRLNEFGMWEISNNRSDLNNWSRSKRYL